VPFGAFATRVIRQHLAQAVSRWHRGGRLRLVTFTDLGGAGGGAEQETRLDPVDPGSTEPGRAAEDREILERLRDGLPPRWWLALALYVGEGYSLDEVARQLGVTRERVRQFLAKARRWAHQHLEAG
jgi:RNA polymerase sigma factor (sigma-70 family)